MLRRWICAALLVILAGGIVYAASTTDDPAFAKVSESDLVIHEPEDIDEGQKFFDDGSITLWYSDDALTEYLTSVALSFQQDQGVKVNVVLKDGVS